MNLLHSASGTKGASERCRYQTASTVPLQSEVQQGTPSYITSLLLMMFIEHAFNSALFHSLHQAGHVKESIQKLYDHHPILEKRGKETVRYSSADGPAKAPASTCRTQVQPAPSPQQHSTATCMPVDVVHPPNVSVSAPCHPSA